MRDSLTSSILTHYSSLYTSLDRFDIQLSKVESRTSRVETFDLERGSLVIIHAVDACVLKQLGAPHGWWV